MIETSTLRPFNKAFLSFIMFFCLFLSLPNELSAQCFPDTTRPRARCRNVTVYLDTTGQAGVDPLQVDNGSFDNCNEWYLILNHPCFFCSDIGNQNITLYVQDRAGNKSNCTAVLTVRDTTRPKLSVRTGLSANLATSGAKVTVTAQQLINTVSDNCTDAKKIVLGVRKVGQGTGFPLVSSLTFACADTGRQVLEIWAKDSTGNTVSRTTTLQISDPNKVCAPVVTISPSIIGNIRTETGKAITAQVSIDGGTSPAPTIVRTSDYNFSNLLRGGNFTLNVVRDTDWINGVTTFDVALITRHILELNTLDSPYKLVAADVDKDGYIDATDILLTRKLILRQINRIPGNTSWRFVPKNVVLPMTPSRPPSNFTETFSFTNVQDTIRDANFIAVKTADVNVSAQNLISNALEVRQAGLQLNLEDKILEAGKTYEIELTVSEADAIAFQFTMNFNKNILKLLNIQSADLKGFSTSNYAIFNEKGMATLSWDGDNVKGLKDAKILKLTFQAEKSSKLSDALYLTSDLTPAQAFNELGESSNVQLTYKGSSDFALLPNVPNPFTSETMVRFRLPENSDVELNVYDETGRTIKTVKRSFSKGYNEIPLSFDTPPRNRGGLSVSAGVYYYQLKTATHSATERMVIMR